MFLWKVQLRHKRGIHLGIEIQNWVRLILGKITRSFSERKAALQWCPPKSSLWKNDCFAFQKRTATRAFTWAVSGKETFHEHTWRIQAGFWNWNAHVPLIDSECFLPPHYFIRHVYIEEDAGVWRYSKTKGKPRTTLEMLEILSPM